MSDTPRCAELNKRHAALTEGALPLLDGASARGFQGCMSVAKKMIEETWALAETLERELAEARRVISEVTMRLERARQALQWIVTDAVYKPPECLADPTVTERWPEVARLALIDTEAPK